MMIINIAGLALIALIVWWFWLYKPKEAELGENDLVITVENGTYSPSRIKVPSGEPVEIKFMRRDQSPCSETLLIPELQISDTLPLNKLKTIQLPAMSSGEYAFHCQMQMYRGQITVQ
ncbi:MAG: cupredoxin domain-containing protein [Porticoccus sp.]|jgi:plastocyanin domain-containing protein|uniref:Cupredoxin domain-containing protein n=1 Tax=Spongiibacter nanhainus TaxID=2794344 RepID=A0A7T4UNK8_9GAMM|nr:MULTISPECIES: cupredoxin domain-containing protein [Cellvibrionales]MCP5173357.1 cupredoxin domain-containing protein [Pseudomonadales bacterium]PHQ57898.1 MAG: cupredoxin domain-containing protein [Porticoccus sp.]MAD65448.1 cupredoxin domain-containing protein [Haliea sp.]MAY91459.1 cupredoxin domain-containing protein [Haliea sp.]MBM68736.1 cupredoxin domain-containing protein [Haliea sp.]|tara:strand:+ start:150 stop:503 length:354 start_codon:yes stop_codon:yes gene_type:complete